MTYARGTPQGTISRGAVRVYRCHVGATVCAGSCGAARVHTPAATRELLRKCCQEMCVGVLQLHQTTPSSTGRLRNASHEAAMPRSCSCSTCRLCICSELSGVAAGDGQAVRRSRGATATRQYGAVQCCPGNRTMTPQLERCSGIRFGCWMLCGVHAIAQQHSPQARLRRQILERDV